MAEDRRLVTVCIPAYNCEKYIGECLRSIITQTYKNIEIIVVNDGSTDRTSAAVQACIDPRLKLIHQLKGGAAAARNQALALARGAYIQFMDADDLLSPDKIEKQVIALSRNTNSVAVCSTVHFTDGCSPYEALPSDYEEKFLYSTNDPVDFMIRLWGGYDFNGSMIQPNAWLTPKSLIDRLGGWNERLTLDDDGEFFARIALNANGVVRTGGFNYYRKYQQSNKNLSSSFAGVGLESLLESTLLKKKYLFEKCLSKEALRASYRQLTEIAMRAYLVSPSVYNCANTELKRLPKYWFKKKIGGAAANLLAQVMGWRLAKRIQFMLRQ